MTQRDIFLDWCKSKKVKPTLMKGSKTIYELPHKVIQITYFGLKIKLCDPVAVYFTEEGRWLGGTNWLWDARLPWIRARKQPAADVQQPKKGQK